ncbi:MAG: hypothetical protein F6K35_19595 [Okeania sp. SIO2H7]|nr:hypothetical protein [Okeania sp. SIO2H7]
MESKHWEINLAKLVARTWADENFRASFLAEPKAILREAGMILEDGAKVIVNEGGRSSAILAGADSGTTVYEISLPSKPDDLDTEQLYASFDESSSSGVPFTFTFCNSATRVCSGCSCC